MPTLVVENVPTEMYESLRERAAAGHRTVPEEMLRIVGQMLQKEHRPLPRLPDLILNENVPAPQDLPRSSEPTRAPAHEGQPRLPDPLPENPVESPA